MADFRKMAGKAGAYFGKTIIDTAADLVVAAAIEAVTAAAEDAGRKIGWTVGKAVTKIRRKREAGQVQVSEMGCKEILS